MELEKMMSWILLTLQLGVLVWSIALCVRAHRTRKEIDRIIKMYEEANDDR